MPNTECANFLVELANPLLSSPHTSCCAAVTVAFGVLRVSLPEVRRFS
jgi:hypothetical protein